MSIYNLMFGVNPASVFVVPVLFEKHPDQLPRFRDAFFRESENGYEIQILTRIGKKYHNQDMGEELYFNHPNFIRFENKLMRKWKGEEIIDDTYGSFFFSVPEKYKEDLDKVLNKELTKTSPDFQKLILDTFPKINRSLIHMFTKNKKENED